MFRPLTVFTLATTVAVSAPVPEAVKVKAPPLAGTTWVGQDETHGRVEYTFEAGGRLAYTYGGTTYRNGTWAQTGDTLTWQTNDRYAEFTLRFRAGGFEGTAENVTGRTWAVKLTAGKPK